MKALKTEGSGECLAPRIPADFLALDFLNSRSKVGAGQIELLKTGDDLLKWMLEAKFIDVERAAITRTRMSTMDLDDAAGQARMLREWFREFVLRHMGGSLGADVVDELLPLNTLLAESVVIYQIEPYCTKGKFNHASGGRQDHHGLQKSLSTKWNGLSSVLFPIAGAIADLVTSLDFARIKQCEGVDCLIVFLGTRKGRARRWCSMARCGNRAKQAIHRERMKSRSADLIEADSKSGNP